MNRFERWILKGIFAKEVQQGPSHNANIKELYSLIRKACDEEFYEDNAATRDAHLRELFESTQNQPMVAADEAVTTPAPIAEVSEAKPAVKKPRKTKAPKTIAPE